MTLADLAILNVGAAISATTAGRIPLNIRSTIGLSLKLWKNIAMARIMRNEGRIVPKVVTILPRIPRNLYPIKMEKITVLDEERDGQDAYEALDMAVYARKTFGMFTGEEVKVHLRFENHLVGAVLDRLGRDVILVPDGEDHFTVWTDVIVSPQFFAWLCGFQTAAKVIGPDDVVKQMAEHVKSIAAQYE